MNVKKTWPNVSEEKRQIVLNALCERAALHRESHDFVGHTELAEAYEAAIEALNEVKWVARDFRV